VHLASFFVLPRLRCFRARVDRQEEEAERRAAERLRTAVLAKMAPDHRRGFEELEAHVDELMARVEDAEAGANVDDVGLRWLLSGYLNRAIALQAARRQLGETTRDALVQQLEGLKPSPTSSARFEAGRAQRRAVVRKRLERWDRTARELECRTHEVALIDSTVRARPRVGDRRARHRSHRGGLTGPRASERAA
jgi:hypothetical protein